MPSPLVDVLVALAGLFFVELLLRPRI